MKKMIQKTFAKKRPLQLQEEIVVMFVRRKRATEKGKVFAIDSDGVAIYGEYSISAYPSTEKLFYKLNDKIYRAW